MSSFIAKKLYQESIIEKSDVDACIYGIQITMANLINFAIALSIGLFTDTLIEMALFYSIFVSLRFFCGGYHAESYLKCFSLFSVTCLCYLGMLRVVTEYGRYKTVLFVVAVIFLGICIFAKAPIEHENRPFTVEERVQFRKRSIQLYFGWSAIGTILCVKQIESLSVGFICVFAIIAIYMLVGRRGKHEEENA